MVRPLSYPNRVGYMALVGMPEPRDGYQGERLLALAAPREPARLIHHRRAARVVLATINDCGTLRQLRLETADHPELSRLGDADRATLQAAVMAMHRDAQEGTADDAG